MTKRKQNRPLLEERLFQGFVQRTDAFVAERAKTIDQKRKAVTTSQLQNMAKHFADELEALSKGASECKEHSDQIDGACPRCKGLWA